MTVLTLILCVAMIACGYVFFTTRSKIMLVLMFTAYTALIAVVILR